MIEFGMEELKKIIVEAGKKGKVKIEMKDVGMSRPDNFAFGDWSTNVAMILAKREKKKPREIAKKLIAMIKKPDFVEKVEVAGGGFINFYLSREYLVRETEKVNYEIEYKRQLSERGKGKTMVIDYSAPNIAKPFGIGHLRSTNIGQAIYNIYKILGWKCIGDNHLGDWGTQFGKMIAAIKHWGEKAVEKMSIEELEKLYVRFHKEAEEDDSLIEEGREWFSKLERGDTEAREIWQKIVDISIKEFDRVYEMLGVKIDVAHGESFYLPMLAGIIEEVKEKGVAKESKGALVVELAKMPPAMLRKSNGATIYFTRDMATIKYRIKEWNPDLMIYEVGADQSLHFRQLFATVEKMGWTDGVELVHVAHGLIRWKNAKFSTRRGDTIHLAEVIEKARERAKKVADKSKVAKEMSQEERQKMIQAVAIGAIKFNDLLSDPRRDIIFDWERVMSLKGNSGPYLQYTYARCQSILGKTKIKEQKNLDRAVDGWEEEEDVLLKLLGRFEEKIIEAAGRFSPSVVAEYLVEVARSYNEFYAKYKILEEKEENRRVWLTKTTASVIGMGLRLLGIEVLEKM